MKCLYSGALSFSNPSPSVWREWIEIFPVVSDIPLRFVSLRVEGVD